MLRDQVFISYSHHDRRWVDELMITIAPLLRRRSVVVWDDSKIRVGAKWKSEITAALSRAKVAVLLVSRRFLASEFVSSSELPPLFEAAEREGLVIFWIAVGYSLYEQTTITDYQAANDPSKPLNSLSESDIDRELVQIAKLLDSVLSPVTSDTGPEALTADDTNLPAGDSVRSAVRAPLEKVEDAGVILESSAANEDNEEVTTTSEAIAERIMRTLPEGTLDAKQIPVVHQRLREELANGRWAWRSIHALSGAAGVDEDTTLAILRADPVVELGRAKSGRIIARMRRAPGQ